MSESQALHNHAAELGENFPRPVFYKRGEVTEEARSSEKEQA